MNHIERVFIIGWDGAGTFVRNADTPNLDRLMRDGASGFDVQTASPTISAQCWGTLLHGVEPDKHLLTNEKVSSETYPDDSPYPSVFRVVRDAYPDAGLASFSAWYPINHGIIETTSGVHKVSMKDGDLAHAAAAYIREHPDLKLMFVQLDLPDAAGHRYGYDTPGQHSAIEETDANMGVILNAIEEVGMLGDGLIIAVTDHGGGGEHPTRHGSDHPLDKTIFWVAAGPGIEPGSAVPAGLTIADTAAVVARALGVTAPPSWEAKLPQGLFAD
ncbi:nucleotide pyrophosphatase [Paenibacillus mesophilus]|uniref:alkaline phosphatase family protein n=1 Tax=Paenibacillus mesophilus TaxID=2582849 RepID=UPI00110ED4AF|nr:alkaline phosphatase family protein [Paenibacillus mesophilus]TMV47421.1 nucleotide pyrophosphatase [Paenibacillus mesophilus]